ncbi:hypothetical protein FGIG_02226, partial [Fasciola gigantica]
LPTLPISCFAFVFRRTKTEVNNLRCLLHQRLRHCGLNGIDLQPNVSAHSPYEKPNQFPLVRISLANMTAGLGVSDVQALWTLCQIENERLDSLCETEQISPVGVNSQQSTCSTPWSHSSTDLLYQRELPELIQNWIKQRELWSSKCQKLNRILMTKWRTSTQDDHNVNTEDEVSVGLVFPNVHSDESIGACSSSFLMDREHQLRAYLEDCEQVAGICNQLTELSGRIRPSCTSDGAELMDRQIESE